MLALAAAAFDPARNPGLAPLDAFAILKGWVGAARVIWIAAAHPADTLLSDLRALASFIAPGLVAVTDSGAPTFAAVADQLTRSRDGRGRPLELLRLPAPPEDAGLASYSNFLPLNGGLLVPAFDAASDARAADMLAEHFPERSVQLVPARELALAGVTLTSLALPHPARLLERDRATVLPRSAWSQPTPDVEGLLQHYIDLAERER